MAGAVHNPSRRALLGAAASVVVGVVGVPGLRADGGSAAAPPPPFGRSPSPAKAGEDFEWRSALAAFEDASAVVEGVSGAGRGLSFEAQEALQGRFDEAGEAMEGALGRLLVAPAPDLLALLAKVRLIIALDAVTLDGGEGCLGAVERDLVRFRALRRLALDGPSTDGLDKLGLLGMSGCARRGTDAATAGSPNHIDGGPDHARIVLAR